MIPKGVIDTAPEVSEQKAGTDDAPAEPKATQVPSPSAPADPSPAGKKNEPSEADKALLPAPLRRLHARLLIE